MVTLSWQSHTLHWGQGILKSENSGPDSSGMKGAFELLWALQRKQSQSMTAGMAGQPALGYVSGWSRQTRLLLLPHLGANKWQNRDVSAPVPADVDLTHKERKTPQFSGSTAQLWFYLAKMNTSSFRPKCLSLVFRVFLFFPFLHIWAITHCIRCAKLHLLLIRIPPWVAIKQWWLPLNGEGNFHLIGVFSSDLDLCGSLRIVCLWLHMTF